MTSLATDSFTGSNGAAWSSTWTSGSDTTGSTSTIQSNTGRLTCGTAGAYVGRLGRLVNITAPVDAVALFKFRFPTGDECYPRFYIRSTNTALDAQGGYYVELTAPASEWSIGKQASYVTDTNLGTVSSFTFTTNTWYWCRFGVVGSAVKARVWADGSSEPVSWDLTATDTLYTTAGSGCGFSLGPGMAASAKWEVDDFALDTIFPLVNAAVAGVSTASRSITGNRTDHAAVSKTVTGAATVTCVRRNSGGVTGPGTASSTVTAHRKQTAGVTGAVTAAATATIHETYGAAVNKTVTALALVAAGRRNSADLVGQVIGQGSLTANRRQPVNLNTTATASASIVAAIGFYFRTPAVPERPLLWRRHGLLARLHLDTGVTILRFGESFQQFSNVDTALFETADAVYVGGHIYFITPQEAIRLRAAGYGVWVTVDPGSELPEIDYSQYGTGLYGTGPYGD